MAYPPIAIHGRVGRPVSSLDAGRCAARAPRDRELCLWATGARALTRYSYWSTAGPEPDMKGLQRCVRASNECCRLASVAFDAQEPPVYLLCSSCARLHTPRQRHLPARWDERGGENVTACTPCPARRTHISSLRMMGSAWGTRSETSALGRAEGGSRPAPQGPPGGSTATPPGPTWPCLCPGV